VGGGVGAGYFARGRDHQIFHRASAAQSDERCPRHWMPTM
jgi:hypothetical protein